ncbi:MAG: M81 family metallopeptidase [Pseudomonadota bacterium]
MMRIALIGLQHETNTFIATLTGAGDFETPSGWPAIARGDGLPDRLAGTSVPMAGALDALAEAGGKAIPILWAMALPSGAVDHAVFESFVGEVVQALRQAGPLDGIFLELHGAMVTSAVDDAEGSLLAAVRDTVGHDVPIVASLDLHANLSKAMVEMTDGLEAYLTYPHVDMATTGRRAMERLLAFARGSAPEARAFRQMPYLLPLIAQATGAAPVDRLYEAAARRVEGQQANAITLTLGFPLADIADAGPAVVVYGPTVEEAESVADDVLAEWIAAREDFNASLLSADEAIKAALAAPAGPGPIVLADVQDNPGGGGTNDTTGLLQALVDARAQGAVMVHVVDPDATAAAHLAGVGSMIDQSVGGRQDPLTGAPVNGPWTVLALGDGEFVGQGPMYSGNLIQLGPVALVERNGVACIIAHQRMQASEPGLLHHLGLTPQTVPILALKSSVHFRGAYQDMARVIIHAGAPGRVPMDLTKLTYKKCQRNAA